MTKTTTITMEHVQRGLDREQILTHVQPRLASISTMDELDERGIAYRIWLNMLVRYYIPLDMGETDHTAGVQVTETLLDAVGLTLDEVHAAAVVNISNDYEISSMASLLSDLMGMDESMMESACPMWVLTNKRRVHGAACILSSAALDNLHKILGERFILLPASIHETLAIPAICGMSADDLIEMVREVNATAVEEQDKLSDAVYLCDRGEVSIA